MNKGNLFIVSGIVLFFSFIVLNGEPVDTLKIKSPTEEIHLSIKSIKQALNDWKNKL